MMDLATELLEKINNSFTLSYQESKDIKKSLEAIERKTVSYEEAEAFAEAIGKMLVEALNEHITADVLPDGKMYFNIAEKILEPTMENNYSLISEYAKDVQEILNSKADIDVKAVKPKYNDKKLKTLISIISNAEDFEHAKRLWNEPVITNAISIVDDTAKANAQLHFNLGLKPVIVRRASSGCCKWCRNLAGVKKYSSTMDRDIFRRHQNCRCSVIYDPRNNNGKVQDVWSKNWNKNSSVLHGLSADDGDSIVQKHKPPILLKTIDFKNEKEINKTLLQFEKEAVYEKIETACIITSNGNVYKCFGTNKSVYPDYDLGDELYGAIVSHNHPIEETDFSFSNNDINLFMEFDLIKLRGCDEKYVYEITRNNLELDELPDDWQIHENFLHCSNIYKAQKMKIGYRRWENENN